ncbi:sortase [Streptomyces sp. NPDC058637]|uniref:sortase n=1 Tax=Streptomyces sp. NPDC058637 TaxID=3346569 RepID=UPI003653EA78
MRNTRIGAGICLAVAALALPAPAAVAADASSVPAAEAVDTPSARATVAADAPAGGQGIHIRPGKASPGTRVTVSTRACGKEIYGKGVSEAAGDFHLFAGERPGVLVGVFEIPAGTAPGTDTVTVKCPPRIKLTDTYEIVGRAPTGAVDAGFGVPTDQGIQLTAGSVLLAGAAAGGVVRMRRRTAAVGD